ncbi:hypothetical protein [Bacillus sp. JJ1562]
MVRITIQFDFDISLVSMISMGMIGFFIYRIYKKQDIKPKVWKEENPA